LAAKAKLGILALTRRLTMDISMADLFHFFDDSIMGYNLLRVGKSYGVSPTTNDFPYEQIVNLIQPSYHTPQSMQQVFYFRDVTIHWKCAKTNLTTILIFGGFPWIPPKNPFGSTSAIYW